MTSSIYRLPSRRRIVDDGFLDAFITGKHDGFDYKERETDTVKEGERQRREWTKYSYDRYGDTYPTNRSRFDEQNQHDATLTSNNGSRCEKLMLHQVTDDILRLKREAANNKEKIDNVRENCQENLRKFEHAISVNNAVAEENENYLNKRFEILSAKVAEGRLQNQCTINNNCDRLDEISNHFETFKDALVEQKKAILITAEENSIVNANTQHGLQVLKERVDDQSSIIHQVQEIKNEQKLLEIKQSALEKNAIDGKKMLFICKKTIGERFEELLHMRLESDALTQELIGKIEKLSLGERNIEKRPKPFEKDCESFEESDDSITERCKKTKDPHNYEEDLENMKTEISRLDSKVDRMSKFNQHKWELLTSANKDHNALGKELQNRFNNETEYYKTQLNNVILKLDKLQKNDLCMPDDMSLLKEDIVRVMKDHKSIMDEIKITENITSKHDIEIQSLQKDNIETKKNYQTGVNNFNMLFDQLNNVRKECDDIRQLVTFQTHHHLFNQNKATEKSVETTIHQNNHYTVEPPTNELESIEDQQHTDKNIAIQMNDKILQKYTAMKTMIDENVKLIKKINTNQVETENRFKNVDEKYQDVSECLIKNLYKELDILKEQHLIKNNENSSEIKALKSELANLNKQISNQKHTEFITREELNAIREQAKEELANSNQQNTEKFDTLFKQVKDEISALKKDQHEQFKTRPECMNDKTVKRDEYSEKEDISLLKNSINEMKDSLKAFHQYLPVLKKHSNELTSIFENIETITSDMKQMKTNIGKNEMHIKTRNEDVRILHESIKDMKKEVSNVMKQIVGFEAVVQACEYIHVSPSPAYENKINREPKGNINIQEQKNEIFGIPHRLDPVYEFKPDVMENLHLCDIEDGDEIKGNVSKVSIANTKIQSKGSTTIHVANQQNHNDFNKPNTSSFKHDINPMDNSKLMEESKQKLQNESLVTTEKQKKQSLSNLTNKVIEIKKCEQEAAAEKSNVIEDAKNKFEDEISDYDVDDFEEEIAKDKKSKPEAVRDNPIISLDAIKNSTNQQVFEKTAIITSDSDECHAQESFTSDDSDIESITDMECSSYDFLEGIIPQDQKDDVKELPKESKQIITATKLNKPENSQNARPLDAITTGKEFKNTKKSKAHGSQKSRHVEKEIDDFDDLFADIDTGYIPSCFGDKKTENFGSASKSQSKADSKKNVIESSCMKSISNAESDDDLFGDGDDILDMIPDNLDGGNDDEIYIADQNNNINTATDVKTKNGRYQTVHSKDEFEDISNDSSKVMNTEKVIKQTNNLKSRTLSMGERNVSNSITTNENHTAAVSPANRLQPLDNLQPQVKKKQKTTKKKKKKLKSDESSTGMEDIDKMLGGFDEKIEELPMKKGAHAKQNLDREDQFSWLAVAKKDTAENELPSCSSSKSATLPIVNNAVNNASEHSKEHGTIANVKPNRNNSLLGNLPSLSGKNRIGGKGLPPLNLPKF